MTKSIAAETAQSPGIVEQTSALASHRSCRQGGAVTPLAVRVELVLVDGEAGKVLARHQAAAVRAALEWVRDNPADHR